MQYLSTCTIPSGHGEGGAGGTAALGVEAEAVVEVAVAVGVEVTVPVAVGVGVAVAPAGAFRAIAAIFIAPGESIGSNVATTAPAPDAANPARSQLLELTLEDSAPNQVWPVPGGGTGANRPEIAQSVSLRNRGRCGSVASSPRRRFLSA